jgi:hypothetical protein
VLNTERKSRRGPERTAAWNEARGVKTGARAISKSLAKESARLDGPRKPVLAALQRLNRICLSNIMRNIV